LAHSSKSLCIKQVHTEETVSPRMCGESDTPAAQGGQLHPRSLRDRTVLYQRLLSTSLPISVGLGEVVLVTRIIAAYVPMGIAEHQRWELSAYRRPGDGPCSCCFSQPICAVCAPCRRTR